MAFAIGLRFYKIQVHRSGDRTPIKFGDITAKTDPIDFANDFVKSKSTPTEEADNQRSWFMEEVVTPSIRSVEGWIRYGTYGFESRLIDSKTKRENYLRKTTDVEEIPLYFQFWFPSGSDFGIAAFQSFQGRSCVTFVMNSMQQEYESYNKDFRLHFQKILPFDGKKFLEAPVKSITMVRSTIPEDRFDKYLSGDKRQHAEYEVTIKAKRKYHLGLLKEYKPTKENQAEVLLHDGVKFDEIKAEIQIGNGRRVVGVARVVTKYWGCRIDRHGQTRGQWSSKI